METVFAGIALLEGFALIFLIHRIVRYREYEEYIEDENAEFMTFLAVKGLWEDFERWRDLK